MSAAAAGCISALVGVFLWLSDSEGPGLPKSGCSSGHQPQGEGITYKDIKVPPSKLPGVCAACSAVQPLSAVERNLGKPSGSSNRQAEGWYNPLPLTESRSVFVSHEPAEYRPGMKRDIPPTTLPKCHSEE